MCPARLNKRDARVIETGQDALQVVLWWNRVGVEDGNEISPGPRQALRQGAGFEACSVPAADVLDVQAFGPQPRNQPADNGRGLVGRVVQNLDLQAVARIVELRYGAHHAFRNVELVVDRHLHREARPLGGGGEGAPAPPPPAAGGGGGRGGGA